MEMARMGLIEFFAALLLGAAGSVVVKYLFDEYLKRASLFGVSLSTLGVAVFVAAYLLLLALVFREQT